MTSYVRSFGRIECVVLFSVVYLVDQSIYNLSTDKIIKTYFGVNVR